MKSCAAKYHKRLLICCSSADKGTRHAASFFIVLRTLGATKTVGLKIIILCAVSSIFKEQRIILWKQVSAELGIFDCTFVSKFYISIFIDIHILKIKLLLKYNGIECCKWKSKWSFFRVYRCKRFAGENGTTDPVTLDVTSSLMAALCQTS